MRRKNKMAKSIISEGKTTAEAIEKGCQINSDHPIRFDITIIYK